MALFYGTPQNDTINASSDDDTVWGYAGNDFINAFEGSDLVYGGSGSDTVYGGMGNDTLIGDSGNDALFGGAGNDSLVGGFGNDSLVGGLGYDTIDGGNGDDKITLNLGVGSSVTGSALLMGGSGNDTIVSSGSGFTENTVFGGTGNDTISVQGGTVCGDAGDDLINADYTQAVFGGTGGDRINGTRFSIGSISHGESGDDFIYTQGTVYGDTGNDNLAGLIVYGGSGNDVLVGTAGAVIGTRQLFGGAGNDSLAAGNHASELDGGAGNDVLTVTSRGVLLTGGLGSDTFVFSTYANGASTITDFAVGTDKINLSALVAVINPATFFAEFVSDTAFGVQIDIDVTQDQSFFQKILLSGVTEAQLSLSSFIF